jgi:hypothetical protein
MGYGCIQLGSEPRDVGRGVDVTGCYSPAWARMMRRTKEAHSSFSTDRRRRFGVDLPLTLDRPPTSATL